MTLLLSLSAAAAELGTSRDQQLYRWHWRKRMPERHGELFTVLARGALNSCLIRFERDGWLVITSRNALRRA